MITLSIGKTNDDNRKVNKNFVIIKTINAELKTSSDIIKPIFILSYTENLNECNYLYCESYKRYYYIQNLRFLTGNRIELECYIDVLNTYKNEIKNINCVIERQENFFNSQYNDNLIPVRSERYITAHSIGTMNDNSIILTVTN